MNKVVLYTCRHCAHLDKERTYTGEEDSDDFTTKYTCKLTKRAAKTVKNPEKIPDWCPLREKS